MEDVGGEMRELILSLTASVLTGSAVWLGQRLLRYRRLARIREFFGVSTNTACLLVSPRHASSPHPYSVHRRDLAALVELAAMIRSKGGLIELVAGDADLQELGRSTEFCIGGPSVSPRAAAHLRSLLPGVRVESFEAGAEFSFAIGEVDYPRSSSGPEYVILAKAISSPTEHPIFIIAGQTARANLAAVRLLVTQYRVLRRTYRGSQPFCLVLRVVGPEQYGPDLVDIAADQTSSAFRREKVDDGSPTAIRRT